MLARSEAEAILESVREVLEHGFGKVEVVVQEKRISMLKVEKSTLGKDIVRQPSRSTAP